MFRKTLLALSALTVIAAAALAPTAASAGGGKGGFKHHHGLSFGHSYGGPVYAYSHYGYGSCWVKRWVDTPFGPRLKRFFLCY